MQVHHDTACLGEIKARILFHRRHESRMVEEHSLRRATDSVKRMNEWRSTSPWPEIKQSLWIPRSTMTMRILTGAFIAQGLVIRSTWDGISCSSESKSSPWSQIPTSKLSSRKDEEVVHWKLQLSKVVDSCQWVASLSMEDQDMSFLLGGAGP